MDFDDKSDGDRGYSSWNMGIYPIEPVHNMFGPGKLDDSAVDRCH